MTWLTVHTHARREEEAAEQLARQGFTVFLPRLRQRRRRSGRLQWITGPLFPRYLFVNVDLGAQDLAVIRSTRGAMNLVRFGANLVPVPDAVISFLEAGQDMADRAATAPDDPYKPGDRVEILEGPFASFEGVFQMQRDADRVELLLELLGRVTPVVVSREHLGDVL